MTCGSAACIHAAAHTFSATATDCPAHESVRLKPARDCTQSSDLFAEHLFRRLAAAWPRPRYISTSAFSGIASSWCDNPTLRIDIPARHSAPPSLIFRRSSTSIYLNTAEDIAQMRVASPRRPRSSTTSPHIVRPGVTTGRTGQAVPRVHARCAGHRPAPRSITAPPGYPPFPGAICTSVNDVICHGIPGDRVLKNGDVVNLDITVDHRGRLLRRHQPHVHRRRRLDPGQRLAQVTYECMWKGIQQMCAMAPVWAISATPSRPHAGSSRLLAWYANTAATASAKFSTRTRRSLHYGRPGHGSRNQGRHDLHRLSR